MRRFVVLVLALFLFPGCGDDRSSKTRWKDVEAARTAHRSNPDSLDARQAYVDTLSSYLAEHPGDDRASRLFLEEEVAYARFLITKGRFASAIPYFEDALSRSPDDEALATELDRVRDMITVPRERFDQLSRNMTRDEVRHLLGSPRPGWIHAIDKSGRSHETWYYKRTDRGLASVSFIDDLLRQAEYGGPLPLD